ncbi:MAG: hypothetical protein ACREDC_00150 [Bradyrhizobium sp.]
MTPLSRRALFGATAIAALALAGCANGSPTLATVAVDVKTIANGLSGALANLPPGTVPASKSPIVQAALADLAVVAAGISSADSAAAAQPMILRVETDVNAVVGILSSMPLPAPLPAVFQAAMVLLPVVEAGVGMAVPVGAAPSRMSPSEARAVLAGAAARR